MIVITVPLLLSGAAENYGIDPVWFGIILVLYRVGTDLAPIGINLFVIQSIWDGKLSTSSGARSRSIS